MPGRGCSCDLPPIQSLGVESVMRVPSCNISNALSPLIAEGIKHVLCDPTGRGPWKLVPGFPTLCPCAFPFADLGLYPSTVGSHSCESDHTLDPVPPPSEL